MRKSIKTFCHELFHNQFIILAIEQSITQLQLFSAIFKIKHCFIQIVFSIFAVTNFTFTKIKTLCIERIPVAN